MDVALDATTCSLQVGWISSFGMLVESGKWVNLDFETFDLGCCEKKLFSGSDLSNASVGETIPAKKNDQRNSGGTLRQKETKRRRKRKREIERNREKKRENERKREKKREKERRKEKKREEEGKRERKREEERRREKKREEER